MDSATKAKLFERWLEALAQLKPSWQVAILTIVVFFLVTSGSVATSVFLSGKLFPGKKKAEPFDYFHFARLCGLLSQDLVYGCQTLDRGDFETRTFSLARKSFVEGLCKVLGKRGTDWARVCILVPKDGFLVVAESIGYSAEGVAHLSLPIHTTVAGECFESKKTRYCPDRRKDKGYEENPKRKRNYFTIACFPIACSGEIFAVLNIDALPAKAFSEEELKIIDLITGSLALSYILERRGARAEETESRRQVASTASDLGTASKGIL